MFYGYEFNRRTLPAWLTTATTARRNIKTPREFGGDTFHTNQQWNETFADIYRRRSEFPKARLPMPWKQNNAWQLEQQR
jgi:hypothetical protein